MSDSEIKVGPQNVTNGFRLSLYVLKWTAMILFFVNLSFLSIGFISIYLKSGIIPSLEEVSTFFNLKFNFFLALASILLFSSQYRRLIYGRIIFKGDEVFYSDSPEVERAQKVNSIKILGRNGNILLVKEEHAHSLKIKLSRPKEKLKAIEKWLSNHSMDN